MSASKSFDVLVIGAGAAGLFCAAQAGRRGRRIAVLEHQSRPGRKILISGGGRCNFTNLRVSSSNFLSSNPHFAKSALSRYTPSDFIDLVRKHKISWHEKTLGQLFCDGSAQQILDLLLDECRQSGVHIQLGVRISAVRRDTRFHIESNQGDYFAPALVIATGGLSIPKMGATGFAYQIAQQFGLNVIKPFPALVPLVFSSEDRNRWQALAGVSCPASVAANGASFRENVLFTHRGLSGPAVLQASSYWTPGKPVRVDWLPEETVLDLPPQSARRELEMKLPARFARQFLETEGFTQPVLPLKRLEERLHKWSVVPSGTEGFEKAEVTGGGIDTSELSSKSMESRRVPGLFFIGEALDVTGWLGGYNFQWAWASAHAAAGSL